MLQKQRRNAKKPFNDNCKQWIAQGLTAKVIQIYDNDIDDADANKQYWTDEQPACILRFLEVSQPDFALHLRKAIDTIWDMMAASWEYQGGEFWPRSFKVTVGLF